MKEEFDYIKLIHKNLNGELSEKEQQAYKLWLNESEEHQLIADEHKAVWEATASYMSQSTPNMATGLVRLKSSIQVEEKKKPAQPKRRILLRIAAAAALVAGLFFVWNQMPDGNEGYQIVQTKKAEQTDIILDDGTMVFVNSYSRLEKLTEFEATKRAVSFSGEAFFEVAKDASRPFVIITDNFEVEVLGTAFNIYAPKRESVHEVVVDHGKVKVRILETDETFILEKGDRLLYNTTSSKADTSKDELQNAQSWRTGQLSFSNTQLKDVIFSLEKHFDIEVQCKNNKMLSCSVTVPTFDNEEVDVVIQTIQTMFNFDLKHRKGSRTYKLSAGSCNN